MPKNFKTNDSQTATINALIDRYKLRNPTATDADALMAFASSWDHKDAAAELPGSADLFESFDRGIDAARDAMTAVARLFASTRETVRQESADELEAKDARIAELEAALAELRAENAELRSDNTAFFAEAAAKDATIAELTERLKQAEAASELVELVKAMRGPQSASDAS